LSDPFSFPSRLTAHRPRRLLPELNSREGRMFRCAMTLG
jgi:hypothetical protein